MPELPTDEIQPEAINDLLDKDPFQYSETDIHKIVAHMRREREAWDKGEKKTKKAAAPKGPAPKSLDDLEL